MSRISNLRMLRLGISCTAELARDLCNISLHLSYMDRIKEVLASSKEAVVLYRQLAEVHPANFVHCLAYSPLGLGTHLTNLGL
jgi:hypothetical protein